MKIYCSCCDKVQPIRIDKCLDAKTNEPFQDIVCAECDLVIASGTGIALAQPAQQQEPVAWLWRYNDGDEEATLLDPQYFDHNALGISSTTPLYTTPPQRKPLTHEQRFDLLTKFEPHKNKWEAPAILIDMVEAAHGIKGDA